MNKKWFIISIVLLLMLLAFVYLYSDNNKIEESGEIPKIVENHLKEDYIDFNEIVKGQWDSLLIIPPYTTKNEAKAESGIKLNKIDVYNMDIHDHVYLLVFIHNQEMVKYAYLPRVTVDIDLESIDSNNNNVTIELPRDKTKFRINKLNDDQFVLEYNK